MSNETQIKLVVHIPVLASLFFCSKLQNANFEQGMQLVNQATIETYCELLLYISK